MLYCGHQITIEHCCSVCKALEDAIIKVWEEEVLCGFDLYVQYDLLADDLANTDVQYSLLADLCNTYFQLRDCLLAAIMVNPQLREKFTMVSAEKDHVVLNRLAKFQPLKLVHSEMLSGSPSRSTELTCINYCNTETHTVRNCLALGHHLAMMCLYSKMGGAI
jgi:hypothetical protein